MLTEEGGRYSSGGGECSLCNEIMMMTLMSCTFEKVGLSFIEIELLKGKRGEGRVVGRFFEGVKEALMRRRGGGGGRIVVVIACSLV